MFDTCLTRLRRCFISLSLCLPILCVCCCKHAPQKNTDMNGNYKISTQWVVRWARICISKELLLVDNSQQHKTGACLAFSVSLQTLCRIVPWLSRLVGFDAVRYDSEYWTELNASQNRVAKSLRNTIEIYREVLNNLHRTAWRFRWVLSSLEWSW